MYTRNERISAFILLIVFGAAVVNAWKFDVSVFGIAAEKLAIVVLILGVIFFFYVNARPRRVEDLSSQDMFVDILLNDIVIGRSNLDRLDPPMGVAMGSFVATDAYDRTLHANVIEGNDIGDRGQALTVQSSDHGEIAHTGLNIEDFSDGLGEIEISVIGIAQADYERFFSANPHYRAYYDLD